MPICTMNQYISNRLGSNKIEDEGVVQLAEALRSNTTVEQIQYVHGPLSALHVYIECVYTLVHSFTRCNLTSESGRVCAEMLKHNNTLKNL